MSSTPEPDPGRPPDRAGDRTGHGRWPVVHPAGSPVWVEAALEGAGMLATAMRRDVERVLRAMVADPGQAGQLAWSMYAGGALGVLIGMGRGPALLADTVEAGVRVLLDAFGPEQALAPAPSAPPGGLGVELFAEDKAAASALVELARARAEHDLGAGLMLLDPDDLHALDDLDEDALERLDPDRPPDPATLDVADASGPVTEFDVAVVLGERAHRGPDLFGVLHELAGLYAARIVELARQRPDPGYHYPGW